MGDFLAGMASGVVVGFLLGILFRLTDEVDLARRVALAIRSTKTTVRLTLTNPLAELGGRYRLLYVRDGRDELSKSGPLRFRTYEFRQVEGGESSVLATSFRHSRTLGGQFKCFVDAAEPAETFAALVAAGFEDVSYDENRHERPNRIWFLLSEFGEARTKDGFRNNFASSPID